MNIMILGGESARNAGWVQDVKYSLKPFADNVEYLDYLHWENHTKDINVTDEIKRAGQLAETVQPYIVVAKSIGTIVASLAVYHDLLRPKYGIFLGFPLRALNKAGPDITRAVRMLPSTVYVQNEYDTVGSANELLSFLEETEPKQYGFIKVAGNATHDYTDFQQLADLVTSTGLKK